MRVVTEEHPEGEGGQVVGEVGGIDHPLGDFVAAAQLLVKRMIIQMRSGIEVSVRNGSPPQPALKLEVFLEEGPDATGDMWLQKLKAEGIEQSYYHKPK